MFNSIYNQQIDYNSAVIITFFIIVGVFTTIFAGYSAYKNFDVIKTKIETKKTEPIVKKDKKPEIKVQKKKRKVQEKNKLKNLS